MAAISAAALFLVPFLPLGWRVLRAYPHLLSALDGVYGRVSFSADTVFRAIGASAPTAEVAVLGLGASLALLVLFVGTVRRSDRGAFTIALATALVLSPIVWMHYYVLLVVPIALVSKRLSLAWFAPFLCWASPSLESFGDLRRLVFGIGTVAATCLIATHGAEVRPAETTSP
jgi:hypothetical protein